MLSTSKKTKKQRPAASSRAVSDDLVATAMTLRRSTQKLQFAPPVTHVYRPLDYAWAAHEQYLRRFGGLGAPVMLLGMNPGPWGMAQSGVPFGEVSMVRGWLKLDAQVGRPQDEHPKRPVLGLACGRNEVSGARVWGWARARFGSPEKFFEKFFVANYCPLCFMESTGRNRTPDKLTTAERETLFKVCDKALRGMVEILRPSLVIGVGVFAEARAKISLEGLSIPIGRIPHPSPANPAANRDWAAQAERAMRDLGIAIP